MQGVWWGWILWHLPAVVGGFGVCGWELLREVTLVVAIAVPGAPRREIRGGRGQEHRH